MQKVKCSQCPTKFYKSCTEKFMKEYKDTIKCGPCKRKKPDSKKEKLRQLKHRKTTNGIPFKKIIKNITGAKSKPLPWNMGTDEN